MSVICVLAPAVIGGWPAISAAVAGAAGVLGLSIGSTAHGLMDSKVQSQVVAVEVGVEDSEVLGEQLQAEEEIVLVRENMRVRVFRDARGKVSVCVEGIGRTKEELRAFGEQVVQKISQTFIYNKLMKELKARDFTIVEETVAEDEAIRLNVRCWPGGE